MSFNHLMTLQIEGGGTTIRKVVTLTGGSSVAISESIADGQTDKQVTFELDQSAMQSIYIVSDQAVTIETNSGSTPTDTLTLAANIPVIWFTGSGLTNPITADITTDIYVTNASGSAANLQIVALTDPTP